MFDSRWTGSNTYRLWITVPSEYIIQSCIRVRGKRKPENLIEQQRVLRELDAAGVMATPGKQQFTNELVIEAAREVHSERRQDGGHSARGSPSGNHSRRNSLLPRNPGVAQECSDCSRWAEAGQFAGGSLGRSWTRLTRAACGNLCELLELFERRGGGIWYRFAEFARHRLGPPGGWWLNIAV